MKAWLFCTALLVAGCSGLEEAEQEKVRKQNAKAEIIYRLQGENKYALSLPTKRIREQYPWEGTFIGSYPKITKDFFRCKGSTLNPMKTALNRLDQTVYLFDCGGSGAHSLPVKEQEEFIYPILIDLLNYIQFQTHKKVIITSGHRCPAHNAYADTSKENQYSKHQVGAEVDFYVEGLEKKPGKVIDLILRYYEINPLYQDKSEYTQFQRYHKSTDVLTAPYYNKEVFVKLYQKNEGRDLDNEHPHPYISIQVRFDKDENRPVSYNWHSAMNGFRRS